MIYDKISNWLRHGDNYDHIAFTFLCRSSLFKEENHNPNKTQL